jgi:pimeloyl-ACP methyl ester carboxylesterase
MEAEGGRLWYEEEGEGPSVVLLHAEAADSRMWAAQWDRFKRGFHTIRVDLPGAGRSDYPEQPWDGNVFLAPLLDKLHIGKTALVGAGLGATLALDFAIQHPSRVWALVAASLAPFQGNGLRDLRAAEVLTLLVAGRPARAADLYLDVWCPLRTSPSVDAAIRDVVHDNIGMLTQIPRGRMVLAEGRAGERAAEIDVPALVIWGDKDSRAAQEAARRLAAAMPQAVAVILPDVDHFVPMRAPERFGDEALSFLERVAEQGV